MLKFHKHNNTEDLKAALSDDFNESIAEIAVNRMKNATAKDWISVDVESINKKDYRITIWITKVEDQQEFYDEWYETVHELNNKVNTKVKIDIR